jgi:hypothetical protein
MGIRIASKLILQPFLIKAFYKKNRFIKWELIQVLELTAFVKAAKTSSLLYLQR